MATGLDEDYRKPKNLTDQLVRLLDDESVTMSDRLRLIIQYILYRDGVFNTDIEKLLAHSQLPPQDGEIIQNLDILGARTIRQIKDQKLAPQPLFARKQAPQVAQEDLSLSRFDPAVKAMLEEQVKGTLDPITFPYTKEAPETNDSGHMSVSQSSLRMASTKPTWARTRPSATEPRQRIIVFMAGGATYSESRACYEISRTAQKDVYMTTSHMVTPSTFLRQVGELSVDRRQLDLPMDGPPPKAPAHVFEREAPAPQPPTAGLAAMTMNSGGRPSSSNGATRPSRSHPPAPLAPSSVTPPTSASGKPAKEHKEKKRGFFKF